MCRPDIKHGSNLLLFIYSVFSFSPHPSPQPSHTKNKMATFIPIPLTLTRLATNKSAPCLSFVKGNKKISFCLNGDARLASVWVNIALYQRAVPGPTPVSSSRRSTRQPGKEQTKWPDARFNVPTNYPPWRG